MVSSWIGLNFRPRNRQQHGHAEAIHGCGRGAKRNECRSVPQGRCRGDWSAYVYELDLVVESRVDGKK
jgi:hypothetical protein